VNHLHLLKLQLAYKCHVQRDNKEIARIALGLFCLSNKLIVNISLKSFLYNYTINYHRLTTSDLTLALSIVKL
jgi:hypothetical protein